MMRTHIRDRARRLSVLVAAGSALALVATGLALGATSAPVSLVYTLKANLAPTPTTHSIYPAARGHFDGLLVWNRGGAAVGPLPAGCSVKPPASKPRSGTPDIYCDNGKLIVPLSKTTGWTLVWRLSFSGLSGPAMGGDINTTFIPKLSPITLLFVAPKLTPVKGTVLNVTSDQAKALLLGKDYAGINTTKSINEIRGTITRSWPLSH